MLCACLCEKVCLFHKCTSTFSGNDFSQDKATRLLPPSCSHTHPLFRWLSTSICRGYMRVHWRIHTSLPQVQNKENSTYLPCLLYCGTIQNKAVKEKSLFAEGGAVKPHQHSSVLRSSLINDSQTAELAQRTTALICWLNLQLSKQVASPPQVKFICKS